MTESSHVSGSAPEWEAHLRHNRQATCVKLPLQPREELVAKLYAEGHTASEVALTLGLSYQTVLSYLRRVRLKYENDGRAVDGKLSLRSYLVADGLLPKQTDALLVESRIPRRRCSQRRHRGVVRLESRGGRKLLLSEELRQED